MDILSLTTEIVASYVGTSAHVQAADIPEIIRSVRAALSETGAPPPPPAQEHQKATAAQIRKSITPDGLTSFVDNKVYKTLKRHLTRHGLSFAEYRQRYGLPGDYPSVAPNYSVARSEMAKKLGLGARGRGRAAPAKAAPTKPKGRKG
ncbi:MucR family transcriptional regulator [soil metagenome]